MSIFINTIHFIIFIFIYIHIHSQFKKSNDLEVFQVSDTTKDNFEEICSIRQPIILETDLFNTIEISREHIEANYGVFEVNIRNGECEKFKNLKILKKDFLSESNETFLTETGMIKELKKNDYYLRPYLVGNCSYDLMIASKNICTPLKYEMNDRTIYIVTEGEIHIKMMPPHSSKYLREENDYENYEFKSPFHPWNIQNEYKDLFDKVKCLEFTIKKGQVLYIPPFWWYSIKFNNNTTIVKFSYQTIMNMISMLPFKLKHILQKQNIKHKTLTKLNTKDENICE